MLITRTRFLAIFALLSALVAPAFADIRAFNAAVQVGDYRAAVAEANATWPAIDRSGPDTAVIAREFAWVAMLAGDPRQAMVWSKFLVEQGRALPHPDMAPAVSRVLHDWAGLGLAATPATRQQLAASLNARAMITGRDLVSPRAALALSAAAWAAGDFGQAESSAALAVRFIDEAGAAQSVARFEARRRQAMAMFMRTKSPDAYEAIYDIATELLVATPAAATGAERQRLGLEYYAATAWGDSIYGALAASRRPVTDRRAALGAVRPGMIDILYPAPGDPALPRCRISLARSRETSGFPFVQRFKDFGGEVIYALEVGPNGALANPRLLAAAPDPEFAAAAQKVATSWRWKFDGAVQPPACRMPKVHVVTMEFAIGR